MIFGPEGQLGDFWPKNYILTKISIPVNHPCMSLFSPNQQAFKWCLSPKFLAPDILNFGH